MWRVIAKPGLETGHGLFILKVKRVQTFPVVPFSLGGGDGCPSPPPREQGAPHKFAPLYLENKRPGLDSGPATGRVGAW